ncbi:MAG: DUF3135 domain-containing protein [Pseudomonadota bacterium]
MHSNENNPGKPAFRVDNVDFDEWMKLYESDPERFEQRRQELIRSAIGNAPEDHQRRLNGLQFQIDMERQRSESSLQGCMRISSMMWERFDELRTTLNSISSSDKVEDVQLPTKRENAVIADVLEFTPRQ